MIVKTYNDIALLAFRCVRDSLMDGFVKHGHTGWEKVSAEAHLDFAMQHIIDHRLITSGAMPDDGESNHLREALCRVCLALMQSYKESVKVKS